MQVRGTIVLVLYIIHFMKWMFILYFDQNSRSGRNFTVWIFST